MTATLFVIGKFALGLYLGHASIGSAYGAAGSLLVLLTWIYYSAQIFLVGAEFVQVWVKERGSKFIPDENAIPLTRDARAAQGIPKAKEVQAAAVRSGKTASSEAMPQGLVGFETGARLQGKLNQREAKLARVPGRLLPALMGLVVGFMGGRFGRQNSPKLILSGPVRLIRRKVVSSVPKKNTEWGDVLRRLKSGFRAGTKKAR